MGEGREEAVTEVYLLLQKYRVQKHYRASKAATVTRYAVFDHTGQITEPQPFAKARIEADMLTAKAIAQSFAALKAGGGGGGG